MPADSSQSASHLEVLLTTAAFAPLDTIGWLRVTGEDRVRWLNGMVTNSITALKPSEGCYTFFLNAQGRIQADATAWVQEDAILLETQRNDIPKLMEMLDRFIIMDDVELSVVELSGLLIAGPAALAIVQALGTGNARSAACSTPVGAPSPADKALSLKQTMYAGSVVTLLRGHSPLVPRFEIFADASTIAAIREELEQADVAQASVDDLQGLRILEGTPLYGTDIRDKELPQETAQTRALHFSKGCYLGQEIVERIHSRGNVHRTFTGFTLTGEEPTPGTTFTLADAPDKPIGELTSIARIPLPSGTRILALGYIRREALDRNQPLMYPGGTAAPTALPFLPQFLNSKN